MSASIRPRQAFMSGRLLPMMTLARLQRHGHTPIALVGGGTGLIGDPSGKSQERSLLTFEQVEENAGGLRRQLERFLDFDAARANAARMRNNVDWLRPIGFLDFLRDVGKHFTVNYMMAKESVKRRLGGDEGISFTEFSYQLLQAYDYLVLHDRDQLHAADGRQRSVGQYRGRLRPDSKSARAACAWSRAAAGHDVERHEVRQDRGGHGVARSGAHLAVSVLSVLVEHRRSRRGEVPEVFHLARSRQRSTRSSRRSSTRRKRARRSERSREKSRRWCTGPRALALAERETAALFGGGDDEDVPSMELPAAKFADGMAHTGLHGEPWAWRARKAKRRGSSSRAASTSTTRGSPTNAAA